MKYGLIEEKTKQEGLLWDTIIFTTIFLFFICVFSVTKELIIGILEVIL